MIVVNACGLQNHPSRVFRPEMIAVPVVSRPRLLSRILGPDARKITLVSAPIGYGKTVLLTQAYEALVKEGRRCLWLSIDGVVGETSLLGLLWAAADRADMPAPEVPAISVNSLLDRIARCDEPVSIVIDGLDQRLTEDADVVLWELIQGAAHGTCFLIATTIALPLPMLRLEAAGFLCKITASDLALDEADIAALGEIMVLPDWISTLNARVEGWPAVVQFALSGFRAEPGLAMPQLSGRQHDIAAFLEGDVLRGLEAEAFEQLLDASVVDQVCGLLLDSLSGGNDGSEKLVRLAARGVPMRELRNRGWFCLHPLLQEYLYDRLQRRHPDRLTSLHQRAANWLLASGDEQAALRHGTASGNIDFLRTIYPCATITQTLLPNDQLENIVEHKTLNATIDTTSNPKWRAIFDLIKSGQLDQAREAIAEARRESQAFVSAESSDIRPLEWELIYSDLLMRVFDDRLPRPDQLEAVRDRLMRTAGVPPAVSAAVSELVIVSRFRGGDLSGLAEADHDLWHTSALAPTVSKIYVLMELGMAALELGDPELAARHLENAKARAVQAFGPDASQAEAASMFLAEIALERGDRALTADLLEQSSPTLKHGEIWFNLAASAFTTASAEAAHASWGEVLQALELPPSLAAHVGLWRLPPLLVALRLRLAVIWGEDLEAARKDRATLTSLGLLDLGQLDSAGFGWRVSIPAQLAVIRFDIADRKAEAAVARAVALRPILEARRHVRRLIELNLLHGRALIEIGDRAAGYALVRAALKQSVESGMVQSFLDEVRFLDAFIGDLLVGGDLSNEERAFLDQPRVKLGRPSARSTRYVANGRTFDLSNREEQLLRALATGKTFKEISYALNISINTTKMHRARLYRKIGCNSRSHAIALAQELVVN